MENEDRILSEIRSIRELIEDVQKELHKRITQGSPKPPADLEEVLLWWQKKCEEHDKWLTFDPEAFFWRHEGQGWIKANGQPVKSWKGQMTSWQKLGCCEQEIAQTVDWEKI